MTSKTWIGSGWQPANLGDIAVADEDEALVARAKVSASEFGALYQRYVQPIYGYCFQRLGEREAAEDATSQIFLKALTALPRYRANSFRAWLFTIARHVIADVRRRRPMTSLEDDPWIEDARRSPEDEAIHAEADQSVRRLMTYLTPDQRDVVELRLAGLGTAEISDVLGRRQGSIRALEFRAHQRLREVLQIQGDQS